MDVSSLALAIEASVCNAGAAAADELLPQRLASPVQPHTGVPSRDAGLFRIVTHTHSIQLYPPERHSILWFERVKQRYDAPAHHRFELLVHFGFRGFGLARHAVECPPLGLLPAEMIGDRVAKHSIEPGDGRFGGL
jgi:hypothetical protein